MPELIEESDSYVVPSAYVPTKGEAQQSVAQKSRRRGFGAVAAPAAATSLPSSNNNQTPAAAKTRSGSSSKLALLLGILGGIILIAGIVLVFIKPPLLGILAIVLGASLTFMGLYSGRYSEEPDYDIVES